MAPVSKTVGLRRVTTQVLPYFSFPFKGKAGMGMGLLRCHTLLPHPHPNLPLEGEGIAVFVLRRSLRPEPLRKNIRQQKPWGATLFSCKSRFSAARFFLVEIVNLVQPTKVDGNLGC